MAPSPQQVERILTKALFKLGLIRKPLMMQSRLTNRRLGVEFEIQQI